MNSTSLGSYSLFAQQAQNDPNLGQKKLIAFSGSSLLQWSQENLHNQPLTFSLSTSEPAVNITDCAMEKFVSLLHESPGYIGFRIIILVNKGCAGSQYSISYIKEVSASDHIILFSHRHHQPVYIAIDRLVLFKVLRATIDYQETEIASEFTFDNKNEKGNCGCGKSVYFEE